MQRTLAKKLSVAAGLLCCWSVVAPSTAVAWSQATHAHIADHVGAAAGRDNLGELWGIVAPDLFIFVFDPALCSGWVSDETHGMSSETFMKVWNAASGDRERALALGFVAHNQAWGADFPAHISSLTLGGGTGYIIAKAQALLDSPSPRAGPPRTFDDEFAALGLPSRGYRAELAHLMTEYAIDLRVRNDVDPLLGRKLARAARGETAGFADLLVRAFAADYADTCFGGDAAKAASVLTAAEEEHRKTMIFLGQAISQPEPQAMELLARQTAALLPTFIGRPLDVPDAEAVEILKAALEASMTICADYGPELEATIDFVRAGLEAHGIAEQPRPPHDLAGALTRSGFEVNPGYPLVYSNACRDYTYPALRSCFGNNPAGPYVVPVVKAWPGEFAGPSPVDAFGPVDPGFMPTYRLEPRDALVLYGRMPPPGKYMSLTTYVWTQHGRWNARDYAEWAATPNHPPMPYVFSTVPPDDPKAQRVWSFSTLGDPVNNVVMERRSGDPFGTDRYFIVTPSAGTDRAIREALLAQGIPDGHIFTERIPRRDDMGPIGPLGMGENAIEFLSFFRYVIPDVADDGRAWWASFDSEHPPLQVLRVRAPPSLGPVQRYDLLTYDERSAQSEAYLAGDLENLVDAVCERVGAVTGLRSADCARPAPASSFMADPWGDFGWAGPYCRKVGLWCGDQTDAGLFYTGPLPLDSGQLYAVVSTLATETGNATYVGLSVNSGSTYLAPAGVLDSALKGSADAYASTVDNTGKFFVHFFTRRCAVLGDLLAADGRNCTELDEGMVPRQGATDALGDPSLFGVFWPGIRDYVAPGTARGPDTKLMLRPRVLAFKPAGSQGP